MYSDLTSNKVNIYRVSLISKGPYFTLFIHFQEGSSNTHCDRILVAPTVSLAQRDTRCDCNIVFIPKKCKKQIYGSIRKYLD